MQEEDIPLLTTVHVKSAQVLRPTITTDLIDEIVAQLKPQLKLQLQEEIEQSVMQKLKIKMHDEIVIEVEDIQKSNQNFLTNIINQQYEQQTKELNENVQAINQLTSVNLKQHVNDELNLSQQASHARLLEAIHTAITQAQQGSVEQIRDLIAQDLNHAVAIAKQSVMESGNFFLDRTTADLKTEIPKMMHVNAGIIKEDLANTLEQMQFKTLGDIQSKLTQSLPLIEQALSKQYEENLLNLEISLLERASQALEAKASLVRTDLEVELNKVQAQGITEMHNKLTEALPLIEQQFSIRVHQTLNDMEATFTGNANHIFAKIKEELESTFVQMREQGISEVQSKLIATLPILKESITEQLESTLFQLETKTVENAAHKLQDKISRLHEELLSKHQDELANETKIIYQGLTEQSQAELTIYLDALQLKSKQQLDLEVRETFPVLFQGLSTELSEALRKELATIAENIKFEFKHKLNAELPEVEEILANKVNEILRVEMPKIEQQLTLNIKSEIEHLLNSVRLNFEK